MFQRRNKEAGTLKSRHTEAQIVMLKQLEARRKGEDVAGGSKHTIYPGKRSTVDECLAPEMT